MFDNTIYDTLKEFVGLSYNGSQEPFYHLRNRCFQLIERFEGFLGVGKWVPHEFLHPVDLASLPSAFPQVSKIDIYFSAHSDEPLFCASFEARVEKGVLPSALLMHPCVLAGFLGLGHGVRLWCGKTP